MNAMVLAAGFGTRLLPYTLKRPKPLFPVLGVPLLELTIARLRAAGADRVVVNAHHLAQRIETALAGNPVILQREETILGTGGGLRRALPHFGPGPLLVTNGDIYHNADLEGLVALHNTSGSGVTLLLHDCPRFNTVGVRADNTVVGFSEADDLGGASRRLAFTGIHVIDPAILEPIAPNSFSCILDRYRTFLQEGGTIRAVVAKDLVWTDMGTPADYLALHRGLLDGSLPAWPEIARQANHPQHLADDAVLGEDVRFDDWVSIGRGARLGTGARLARVVVWDGAEVAAGAQLADTIVA